MYFKEYTNNNRHNYIQKRIRPFSRLLGKLFGIMLTRPKQQSHIQLVFGLKIRIKKGLFGTFHACLTTSKLIIYLIDILQI